MIRDILHDHHDDDLQYEENRPLWEAYYAAAIAGAVEEGMLIVNKERTAMCVLAKPGQHFSTFDLNS